MSIAPREGESPSEELRRRVSHYDILGELGRGGMGIVYRAVDADLGRPVALKRPWPELAADSEHRKRFLREARAASSLSHPNVVAVYEVFEEAGVPWIAFEHVDGTTLRTLLKQRGVLPLDEILRYAEGLADALRAAHARHILHRDINPKNILISSDGRARLTDFGLAAHFVIPGEESSASTQESDLTVSGAVVGTPGYMSPEQALGKPVDQRSDLFSLGAVFYEMAAGTPAFAGSERGALIDAILHQEPKAIARLNYEIPGEYERITRKLLAKREDERYQDARDLVADLRALKRQTESGVTTPPGVPGRRFFIGMSALTAALTAAAVAAVWWLGPWRERIAPLPEAIPRQITSGPGWETEPAISPDGTLIAFSSNQAGQADIWLIDGRGGSPLRLTDDPAVDASPAWFPDGSALLFVSGRGGEEGIWKVSRLGGPAAPIAPNAFEPSVAPDGHRIAFARPDASGRTRIAVAEIANPRQARVLTSDTDGLWEHREPSWSPDGQSIVYAAFRDLWVIPSAGGSARRLTTTGSMDRRPQWSPDGLHVYFASDREGTLAIWRVASTGGTPERVTMGTGPEAEPSLSADGIRLAYSTHVRNPDLTLVNLSDGARFRIPDSRVDAEPSLAPDGNAIVFKSDRWGGRMDLWLQPVSNGLPTGPARRLTDHPGSANHPAFSPDGRWIAYYRVIDQQRDIWIIPTSGGAPVQLTSNPAADVHPDWSPDGSRLAFVSDRDGGWHLWVTPIESGLPVGVPIQITRGDSIDLAPAWSPDGRFIAYISMVDGRSDVWLIPLDGNSSARRLTSGAEADRVRWLPSSRDLLVAAEWGGEALTIQRISIEGGEARALQPPLLLGPHALYNDFSVSRDGRILAFTQEDTRGDLWVLEGSKAAF